MSLITDLVLVTSLHETEAIARLNTWCARHAGFGGQTFGQLNGDGAGGRKFLCSEVWAMAGNHVAHYDLIAALPSFGWRYPEQVFLYVDHEGDEAVVYSARDTDGPLELTDPDGRFIVTGSSAVWGGQLQDPVPDELVRRMAAERLAHPLLQLPGDGPVVISGDIGRAIDTVQAVRNQFEPSFALVEFSEALIAQLMAVRRGEPWPVPEVAHADGPDADCPHMEFEAGVTVQRILGDNLVVAGFWAEVTVACTRCDEVFRWTGVEPGLSPAGPRVSIDHRTLHVPFHRASRDPDEGQGLPGFDVNLIGPELGHERTAAAIRRRALEDAAELVKGRETPVMSIAARRELRRAEAELRRLALATS